MESRRRFNIVEVGMGVFALTLLTMLGISILDPFGGCRIQERGQITSAVSNCRQIITALRIYASDHDGKYPDAHMPGSRTSNTVFRQLFKEDVIDNEMIFGAQVSPFQPDNKIENREIGPSSKFEKAVEPGENHWAMTAGLSASASGNIPLVYENPVTAAWPPRWNANMAGKAVRGRTCKKGIIIGLNDSSVSLQPLASEHGISVGLKQDPVTGRDAFEAAIDPKTFPKGEVLNVE
jgi:hypothetical protein